MNIDLLINSARLHLIFKHISRYATFLTSPWAILRSNSNRAKMLEAHDDKIGSMIDHDHGDEFYRFL